MMKPLMLIILLFSSQIYADATTSVLGQTATGAATGAVTGAVQKKATEAVVGEGFTNSVGEFFDSPPGIVALAGISTVYSGVLYNAASEQEKESQANIAKIEKIIKSYGDSWTNFCPNGRDKLEEPQCYCYLDNNKKNTNRSNSQTCIDLWAKNDYMLNAKATAYSSMKFNSDPSGCVAVNGQFDERCQCKKLVNSKGQNACMKAASISLPNDFANTLVGNSGLKEVMKFAANSANGNPNLAAFNTGSLGLKAIANDRLTQALLSKLGGKIGKNSPVYATEENVNQIAKSMFGEKAMQAAISRSSAPLDYSASVDSKSAQILEDVKKKNSLDLDGSGKGLMNKKKEKKGGLDFNFGEVASSTGGNVQGFAEAPEKNYKYNDIAKNSDVSIFEIISNRYVQSGLKRLFEEPEDAPKK